MDVNTAIKLAKTAGGDYRWDTNLKLHVVYFDRGLLYFTTSELSMMPEGEFDNIMYNCQQREADLAERYGRPTTH